MDISWTVCWCWRGDTCGLRNITFSWFLLLSLCHSLHVIASMCINCSLTVPVNTELKPIVSNWELKNKTFWHSGSDHETDATGASCSTVSESFLSSWRRTEQGRCVCREIAEVRWHAEINRARGLLSASTVWPGTTVRWAPWRVYRRTSTGFSKPSDAMFNVGAFHHRTVGPS